MFEKSEVINFDPIKAKKIANQLNSKGRICYLLDSLDQATDTGGVKQYFGFRSSQYLENNIVVLACRQEQIHLDPEKYRRDFNGFTWVFIDKFNEDQLRDYLGLEIMTWLNFNQLPKNLRDLLQTPFYANIAKCLGLRPVTDYEKIEKRFDLLENFIKELFRQAIDRGIGIHSNDEEGIKDLLYKLSFNTLSENKIQSFPVREINSLNGRERTLFNIITNAQWLYRRIFEGNSEKEYVFYHQLLQEYFAACKMYQDMATDMNSFNEIEFNLDCSVGSERKELLENTVDLCASLEKMPFSEVLLDFLDEKSPDKLTFDFCMNMIKSALELSDLKEEGLATTGHKFTWLVALRDRKGEKPELSAKLQYEFDKEMKASQETENNGDFVKIPAGAFLMGGYEYFNEMPVRVVYLPDYWISRYAGDI